MKVHTDFDANVAFDDVSAGVHLPQFDGWTAKDLIDYMIKADIADYLMDQYPDVVSDVKPDDVVLDGTDVDVIGVDYPYFCDVMIDGTVYRF